MCVCVCVPVSVSVCVCVCVEIMYFFIIFVDHIMHHHSKTLVWKDLFMFLKEMSCAHQSCNYLIQYTAKQ